MPRPLDASDFPAFHDFSPEEPAFHCIFPLARCGFRRCGKPVNRRDRMLAGRLRELIVLSKDDEGVLLDLEEYARLCCCVANHRGQILKEELLASICRDWRAELRSPTISSPENRQLDVRQDLPSSKEPDLKGGEKSQRNATPLSLHDIQDFYPSAPLTRAVTQRLQQDGKINLMPPTEFVPYKTGPSKSMFDALEKTLTKTETVSGELYCFSRLSDPGMRKIGFTTKTVPERLRQWQEKCLYSPILEHQAHTPNAKRAESLVHLELITYRRKETKCRHNPDCVTIHEEWMAVDIQPVTAAMDRWATWMTQADPYDTLGRLKEEWRPCDAAGKLKEEWKQIREQLKVEGRSMSEALLLMMKDRRSTAAQEPQGARPASDCEAQPSGTIEASSERETVLDRALDAGAREESLAEMVRLLLAEVQKLGRRVQALEGAPTVDVRPAVAVLA